MFIRTLGLLVLVGCGLGEELETTHTDCEWIILHYNECKSPQHKHFKGDTLGYITNWNSKGAAFALKYARKLNYVSPVWHQLSIFIDDKGDNYSLGGEGDPDFISKLKKESPKALIVPRLILENTKPKAYKELLKDDNLMDSLGEILADLCSDNKYDGVVLELWIQGYMLLSQDKSRNEYIPLQVRLIERIGKIFLKRHLKLILTIPPLRSLVYSEFDSAIFLKLSPVVHRFQIISYDFSTQVAGPNSPSMWVKNTVEHLLLKFDDGDLEEEEADERYYALMRKILIGIPFYGYRHTPINPGKKDKATHKSEPIINDDYLDVLNAYKPKLTWSEKYHEHELVYTDQGRKCEVYYPSVRMIQKRLEIAEELGVGVAIWELGQGLDIFFDIL